MLTVILLFSLNIRKSNTSYIVYIIYTEVIIMPNGMHSHRFMGRTTFNDGHVHGYSGMTSLNPNIPGHMHYITGETTFEDGHIHRYSLQTGPSITVYGGIYTIIRLQHLLMTVMFTICTDIQVYTINNLA